MVDSAYFVKSTPLRAFTYLDIFKMCMKKFDVEKVFFDKLTAFLTLPFSDLATNK